MMTNNKLRILIPLLLSLFLISIAGATSPTIPSGIQSYVPINLTNSQSTATASPFQQMVNITESTYSSYIAYNNNLANFEYFYSNGTIIPAWIESNSSGKLITWVKIAGGIPASSKITIYLGFTSKTTNLLSSSGTSGIGEAPQLSPTYAEYDDGADVFPYYQRWGGLSALPTGWASVASTVITFNPTNTVISPDATVTGWYGIYLNPLPASLSSTTTVWDVYGNMYESVNAGSYIGTSTATTGNWDGYSFGEGDTTTNLIYFANGGTQYLTSTGYDDTNTNKIYTMSLASATSLSMQINYTNIYTTTTATSEAITYFNIAPSDNSGTPANPITIYWLRTRAYPPNGVMPSVSFGAVQTTPVTLSISPNPSTYGQSITITASCPTTSTDTCAIDYPTLGTAIATGTGTATYTYSPYALAAGTYSSFYANDITQGTNSIGQTLTINKNSTYTLAWIKKGTNQTWSNTPINTTAQITTHNNQLSANLYLNSGFIATTTTTTTQLNKIGFYHYVFNTTGNTNYTANSISYTFWVDVPIGIENISATGTALTKSINYSKSPFTWNTYYPVKLYTSSPSNSINYTLTQNLGGTLTTISTNTLNISYIPPANQITGNYIYSILERQSNDSQTLTLTIAANTLNMTDISSPINFSSQFQYFPILAHNPTWTAKPTSWYVASSTLVPQITQNTSAGAVFSTNVIGTFTPQIHLVYPFASFILNYSNNPKVQNSITIQKFQYTLANSLITSLRNIANLTIYNQETFNNIAGANATFNISTTFNNYIFTASVTNNTDTNGKYFLEIPKSNYLNPNITFQLNGTVIKPLFFAPLQTFCPSTVSSGSASAYDIGLVDTNGTKYSFYVYTSTGTSAQGYILFMNELQGVSARAAQSLVIPTSLPMAVPLEQTGQEYQYIIYSPNCKSVYYKGSFIDPTNPTYLTLTTGTSQVVFYNTTNVTGACALNSTTNPYKLVCAASDSSSQVYRYELDVFKSTNILGATTLVRQIYENTSVFSYNTVLPINNTYSYALYAYAFKNVDPKFLVNGGPLLIQQISYSAPLLGVFTFILLITLAFVGIKTGKPIIILLLMNVGLLAVSMLNLAQIPSLVSIVFIIIGVIVSVWSIKVR